MSENEDKTLRIYRVRGIYQMTFLVEVDMGVGAYDEEEALEMVQDGISLSDAYDECHEWSDGGPEILDEGAVS